MEKVVVAHPYQQHSFRIAVALDQVDMLKKYVTTVYDKKGSITNFVKNMLSGENKQRAGNRHCKELSDLKVLQISEMESLFLLLLSRVDKKRKLYNLYNTYVLRNFNKKLGKYLIKNGVEFVILYDTVSADCIKWLKRKHASVKIIIDMSAPNFCYMDCLYKKDMLVNQSILSDMNTEMKTVDYKRKLENSKVEIENADYFLVASALSKKSLLYSGISEDNIFLCRYGIDISEEYRKKKYGEKVNIVFIGDVTPKKGVHYLNKIIEILGTTDYSYYVLGKYDENNKWYQKMKSKCSFYGYVTHDQVLKICKQMDIIFFPSLADGFGLSVIEAMSNGVIPFVSENSGVSDIISHRENGFIFKLTEIDNVIPEIETLAKNKKEMEKISRRAYETANNLSWKNYELDVQNAIQEILRKEE